MFSLGGEGRTGATILSIVAIDDAAVIEFAVVSVASAKTLSTVEALVLLLLLRKVLFGPNFPKAEHLSSLGSASICVLKIVFNMVGSEIKVLNDLLLIKLLLKYSCSIKLD